MRGIVIAGGLGTRLRPLTLTRPKPLMPLAGAPLLEYQLSYLRAAGISEVCFATNYMSEAVEQAFGDGSSIGMHIAYAVEAEPLDTAGAIRNAYDTIPGEDCVVFNGDVIHGFDIAEIVRKHQERDAFATLTLKAIERPHAYGVVPIDADNRVLGFLEPTDEQKREVGGPSTGEFDNINAGLYVMKQEAIEAIPQRRCNIEREIFPDFVAKGERVFGDVRSDFWIDIGKPSQYLEAIAAIVSGEVASPRPFLRREEAAVDPSAEIADDVRLCCGCSVGANATIESGAEVCNTAVLEGAHIGKGCKVMGCIIGEGAAVGAESELRGSAIAPRSVLGEHSRIGCVK
jgi:NDP-sugar pyrophosphorylase family protein